MGDDGRKYAVATAGSKYALEWKNGRATWAQLVAKLTKENKTKETMAEYLAMSKEAQGKVKDVGGFVGGHLLNGRRRSGCVTCRSLATLDIDEGYKGILADLLMLSPWRMIIYSTHKHTPDKPRLRLVIPMSRDVTADEYEPVARKAAELLGVGMDCFDDSTYEPTRLMYYPSSPKDAEFVGVATEGEDLDPDKVLAEYKSWRDCSSWPTSSREKTKVQHAGKTAGDPTEKPGIIGLFCRAYPIEDAMREFLSDVYKGEDTGRWTYLGGSTSGGVIVYDSLWAYSNHGTDPARGLLCNAFDLVRIHKFGHLDEKVAPDEPIGKWPSYREMRKWAEGTEGVQRLLKESAKEKMEEAYRDFEGLFGDESKAEPEKAEEDLDWTKKLKYRKDGKMAEDAESLSLIMENDPNLRGLVGVNSFKGLPELRREAPWTRSTNGEHWTDEDEASLRSYLNKVYGVTNWGFAKDALSVAMAKNAFNPVRDYIESAQWDGAPRCEELFIKYLGAEDNVYVRTVTRKMLVAAVARIYRPGTKFDYMVTLVGKQGVGKSLLIYKLGNGWASDTMPDLRSKAAYEALDGVWLMEMGELVALKKADRESIKLFISKTEDTYRKAYAHNVTVNKRTCIFIGTTNDDSFLNDATGARRFLVIDTDETKAAKRVWEGLDKEEVAQIWAEALTYYKRGEKIMEMPKEVTAKAIEEQVNHSSDNARIGAIEVFLEKKLPAGWKDKSIEERVRWFRMTDEFKAAEAAKSAAVDPDDEEGGVEGESLRMRVCTTEIWCECYGREMGSLDKITSIEIGEALTLLGWKRDRSPKRYGPYGTQRGFLRPVNKVGENENVNNEENGK